VSLLAALGLFLAAELVLWASLGQLRATSTEGNGPFFVVMFSAFAAAAAIAGTMIVTRQPRNMIGWLLLAIPVCPAFALLAGAHDRRVRPAHLGARHQPLGIGAAGGVIRVLSLIGGFSCLLAAFLAGAALVARFRSRRGDERQQIKQRRAPVRSRRQRPGIR